MFGFDGAAYDRWLEAPYVDAAKQEEHFEAFCEANDVDPNDDNAWELFEASLDADDDF